MSQIGSIHLNAGKKTNIAFSQYTAYDLLKDWPGNLAPNNIILCSPVKSDGGNNFIDAGSYALVATDSEGNPVRLTYTLVEGNGLVVNSVNHDDFSYDTMSLEIDHDSLMTNAWDELHVAKSNIIDNNTLMVNAPVSEDYIEFYVDQYEQQRPRTRIGVMTANLDKASDMSYGIVRGDGTTINIENGVVTVNTQNLDYVDDANNISGIVRFNPDITDDYDWRTVEASNGVLRVVTYNLDRATAEQVGVVKPDMVTTMSMPSGDLTVITAGLDKATSSTYGIVKPDNYTVKIQEFNVDDGVSEIPGILTVDARNLSGATNEEYGVVKLDSYSLSVNSGGFTQVNRFHEIVAILDRYMDDYNYIISRLINHENRISALENAAAAEYIYSFNNYGNSTTTLAEPYWDDATSNVISESELKTAVFSINTNCPFHVSFEFEDNSNVTPQITLQTVRLGNGPAIEASALQNYNFSSTNMNESTLSFTFNCRNYASSTDESFILTTVIVKVSSINDSSIYKIGSHIFKRWNINKYKKAEKPTPVFRYIPNETVTHEYFGPYLQYYTNGELQAHTASFVNSNEQNYATQISESATAITTPRDTIYQYPTNNQAGLVSYQVSYSADLGTYVYITAYQLARTSYNFKFSTMVIDKKTTSNSVQAIDNEGNIYNTWYDQLDENKNKYIPITDDNSLIFDFDAGQWVDNENSLKQTISTQTEYLISYGSSPLRNMQGSQIYAYGVTATVETYTRPKTGSGIDGEWQNGANRGTSSTDTETVQSNPNWFSYNISTLASNTGNYNILTLGSSIPLSNVDRKATITLRANNIENTNNTDPRVQNIASMASTCGFSQTLKFSLIEDLELPTPQVSINAVCKNDPASPLEFNVVRSADSIVNDDNWKVKVKYSFVKSAGSSPDITGQEEQSQNSGSNSKGNTRGDTGQGNDTPEQAPTEVELTMVIPAAETSYTWTINSLQSDTDKKKYLLSTTLYNYYYNNDTNFNDVYTIMFTAPDYESLHVETQDYITGFASETVDLTGANVVGLPRVYGSWPINLNQTPANTTLSFGNAEIRNISVGTWGDDFLDIDFTIRPGSTTRLTNSTIQSVGTPDIVFYNGNTPIHWSNYYNRCRVDCGAWTASGCTVKIKLDQKKADNDNLQATGFKRDQMSNGQIMVGLGSPLLTTNTASNTNSGNTVILAMAIVTTGHDSSGHTAQQNTALGNQHPLMTSMTGIKFYFKLTATATGKTCSTDFAPTMSGSLSSKMPLNATFNHGGSSNVQVSNALYSSHIGVTQQEQAAMAQEQSAGTSISDLANEIAHLQQEISNMQNQQTNNM